MSRQVGVGGYQGSGRLTSLPSHQSRKTKRIMKEVETEEQWRESWGPVPEVCRGPLPLQRKKEKGFQERICSDYDGTGRSVCEGDFFGSCAGEFCGKKRKSDLCGCGIKSPMHTVGYHEALMRAHGA